MRSDTPIDPLSERNRGLEEAIRQLQEQYRLPETAIQPLRESQEEQLNRERWATLGQFARGIGHELRNPLGAIRNAAYFLGVALKDKDGDIGTALAILNGEVETANKLLIELLEFANPCRPQPRLVQVNDLIQSLLSEFDLPKPIRGIKNLDPRLPLQRVDGAQLKQALTHLLNNAVQAITRVGTITLTTAVRDATVRIAVTDTGCGIAPNDLDKIFQPLFTTKAKGLGLGLSISRRLVEHNGGALHVESQIDCGSTFTIVFPAAASTDG